MAHFGGINPVRQQQRAQTLRIALGAGLVLFFIVVGVVFLDFGSGKEAIAVKPSEAAPTQIATIEVLVPVQALEAGTELKQAMFRKETRPKQGMSTRVIRDFEEIKGFYSRSLIAEGVPLVSDYITSVRPTNAITLKIPEGFRAVSIRVDATSAVEGWARPGARVDVVWRTSVRGAKAVKTIVHNAEVLSAERSTSSDEPAAAVPSTVTLLVPAKDAQKIQLAASAGTLTLSLRGDEDKGKAGSSGSITIDDLLDSGRTTKDDKNIEGTIKIGGVEYNLVDGKMVLVE